MGGPCLRLLRILPRVPAAWGKCMAQAPAGLPAIDTSAPASQDRKAQRLAHIVWMVQEGRFPGVQLIDLTDPGETLQAALDREAPGLDLDQTAAVFLPRW